MILIVIFCQAWNYHNLNFHSLSYFSFLSFVLCVCYYTAHFCRRVIVCLNAGNESLYLPKFHISLNSFPFQITHTFCNAQEVKSIPSGCAVADKRPDLILFTVCLASLHCPHRHFRNSWLTLSLFLLLNRVISYEEALPRDEGLCSDCACW